MVSKSEIKIITYPVLSRFPALFNFTSTRNGGVSSGNFSSLNLGLYTDDKADNIDKNFLVFFNHVELISEKNIFLPYQTHEDKIVKIDDAFISSSREEQQKLLHGVDALITNLPQQCIAVTTADCVPILLYDPVQKALAAIHAGWRSTRLHIVRKTVEALQKEYQSKPADIVAAFGPSISANFYRVGRELFDEFEKAGFDHSKIFFQRDDDLHLDLWTANRTELEKAGVRSENIEISGRCTYLENELFFSARKQGISSGRIISGVMLKE